MRTLRIIHKRTHQLQCLIGLLGGRTGKRVYFHGIIVNFKRWRTQRETEIESAVDRARGARFSLTLCLFDWACVS